MKQKEMASYLKIITILVAVLFLFFVGWFLPVSIVEILIPNKISVKIVICIIGYIWVSSIPCLLALIQFWKICCRISKDQSFCIENAKALKEMSIYMLIVLIECAVGLGALVITSYYQLYTFSTVAIFIAMVISVTLAVVCAALSHLVHKASMLQEEHDLTV